MKKTEVISHQNAGKLLPPETAKKRKELAIHGHKRIDYYYWLNERNNPEVLEYLNAENRYTYEYMKHTVPLQEKLFNEITGRIKKDDQSVPFKKRGFFYYIRYEEGKEYPIYCRKKDNLNSPEEIMLDVNKMAEGFSYYSITGMSVSPDNKILAYGVDNVSRRIYDIYFKNLETGGTLPYKIKNTNGTPVWANDNKTIFYSLKDDTLRSYKIMKHKLNSNPEDDVEIYHEKDETFYTYAFKTKSEKYIFIACNSSVSNEYRYIDAEKPDDKFVLFHPRERNHEYAVNHYKDRFYIVTNYKAKNFRLMSVDINKTGKENWEEIIHHRKEVLIERIEIFNNYLVIEERDKGLIKLRIINWYTKEEHYIDFGEETYIAYISINPEFNTDFLRFGYSSLTTPSSVYDYNMKIREKILLKQEEIIGDFNPENYHAERLYAEAKDGKKVPVSLVYRTELKSKSGNPLLLYGYGSYGISNDPFFSSTRLSLLDRGFIFAIAHVRGGQDLGREWYEDGKFFNKKNTFTDFIACAEYVIAKGYTSKDKMFAMGGSAGGLLIGAVINMRPELFNAVVAAVPFVDVMTTMLDESIPLTTGEYDEWGNPNSKDYYDYILSYSPYDNIKKQNYPATFVLAGLHDSQVQYWEPAKWVAKLRDLKTDKNPVLLYTNMEAGHSGASGRFVKYKETAMEYAFLLDRAGIKD